MEIKLTLQFKGGGELTLDKYSTLDIQRQGKQLHINATNTEGNLEFNSLYDKILEILGDDETETFDISIEQGGAGAAYGNMVVNYHFNVFREILHFTQKQEAKQEE